MLPIGAMLAVTLTKANEVTGRALWGALRATATCSASAGTTGGATKLCESEEVAVFTDTPRLEKADGWHHVVAQFTPKKMTLWLDGKLAAEYAEEKWLPDLDTVSFFAGFNQVQLDNIRVYEAK